MINYRLDTKPADLACIGDFQAVNDFARGNIDFTTTIERFFKQADIDLMLGATVTALTNYFTRGALGAYAIPETLAVAKASKFLRKDFPNICTNFFSKKAGKGTGGSCCKNIGLPAPKIADHHIFPQKYKPIFEKLGIDIDKYTVSLGSATHLRGIHGKGTASMPGRWNERWREFFMKNPNPTTKEVYQFAGKLMDEYGINKEILHAYKK